MFSAHIAQQFAKHAQWVESGFKDGASLDLEMAECPGADLSDQDLTQAEFSYCLFDNARFIRTTLLRARIKHTSFTNAVFTEANFYKAECDYNDFTHALMQYVNAERASFDHAMFADADLSYADLSFVGFIATNLTNAKLYHCWLKGAFLTNTVLTGACLYGADLHETRIFDDSVIADWIDIGPPGEPQVLTGNDVQVWFRNQSLYDHK